MCLGEALDCARLQLADQRVVDVEPAELACVESQEEVERTGAEAEVLSSLRRGEHVVSRDHDVPEVRFFEDLDVVGGVFFHGAVQHQQACELEAALELVSLYELVVVAGQRLVCEREDSVAVLHQLESRLIVACRLVLEQLADHFGRSFDDGVVAVGGLEAVRLGDCAHALEVGPEGVGHADGHGLARPLGVVAHLEGVVELPVGAVVEELFYGVAQQLAVVHDDRVAPAHDHGDLGLRLDGFCEGVDEPAALDVYADALDF